MLNGNFRRVNTRRPISKSSRFGDYRVTSSRRWSDSVKTIVTRVLDSGSSGIDRVIHGFGHERRRARYLFRSTAAPPSSNEIGQWTISVERRWSSTSDWFVNTTERPIALRKELNERLIFKSVDLSRRWFLEIHLDNGIMLGLRYVDYIHVVLYIVDRILFKLYL